MAPPFKSRASVGELGEFVFEPVNFPEISGCQYVPMFLVKIQKLDTKKDYLQSGNCWN